MEFSSQLTFNKAWNYYLSELIKLMQQWGHCGVPQKYDKKLKLNQWVKYQRN